MGITVKARFFGEQLGDGVAVMGRESTVLLRASDLVSRVQRRGSTGRLRPKRQPPEPSR